MKKNKNKGFMLAETLVVTTFVAGILLFTTIQFINLSNGYNENYKYNTVEAMYALNTVKNYILDDSKALDFINNNVTSTNYVNLKSCDMFTSEIRCQKLLELEGISEIIIATNKFDKDKRVTYDDEFKNFISKIKKEGTQKYRLIAKFDNSVYATVRFGE